MVGIVCTISNKTVRHLKKMKDLGMSIIRINGAYDIPDIRKLRGVGVPILIDLPGKRKKERQNHMSDRDLLDFAIENRLDYVGLSYIDSGREVDSVRKYIETKNGNTKIVGKVETMKAIINPIPIVRASDIVLIDRGDLGTDIGFEKVPYYQQRIIRLCNQLNKKIIVATEMLMSVINNRKPNCADVNDVFTAVIQGADFLMLSEETAVGNDPINAVRNMAKIIRFAEKIPMEVV